MGRPKDTEFWEHVERMDGDTKCKFCRIVFKGEPSISRIKPHLAGIPGKGIRLCKEVPPDVEAAAKESTQGRNNKRKTMSNSSINEVPCQHNEGMDNMVTDEFNMDDFIMDMDDRNMDQPVGEGGISSRAQMANQTENHVGSGESMQLVETIGDELLTTELIGEWFEEHLEKITDLLIDDDNDVLRIGIYGMGGVGKTELAKHINNKLLTTPNTFHHVYWVTVSIDSSIHKLQNAIAEFLDLDLSRVEDELIRAARLSKALINKKKSVLILDDVWSYIPLTKVGIPVSMNECKLVLTTRSLDVCQEMSCHQNIKVDPLYDEEEIWKLFSNVLGHQEILSPEIEEIAKSISKECKGLPLAIELIATKMRGVDHVYEWRDAHNKLKGSITRQVDVKIFNRLKLSYDNLNDSALQQCFLYCALYPEDYEINGQILIDNLIAEGIIEEMKSRQSKLDRGHSIINRLEKVGLLELEELEGFEELEEVPLIRMHGLLRDLAIQIKKMNSSVMVQAGEGLEKMPDMEKWTKDLVRCSLMKNCIVKIPTNYSPSCPKLTTLLLGDNEFLKSISGSFFVELKGVKVLDLSHTSVKELPSSISYLVNLSTFLLRYCEHISNLPSLSELRALKKLDLYRSGVKEVPRGIELLFNLNYLDLEGTNIRELPPGILPELSNLQFLNLGMSFQVEEKEVASLKKLEFLSCKFSDFGEFNEYNKSITSSNLSRYHLNIGERGNFLNAELSQRKTLHLHFDFGLGYSRFEVKDIIFLPKGVQSLQLKRCDIKTNSLCLENATELKSLDVGNCDGMECLLSLSSPCIFQSPETIVVSDLEDLRSFFSREIEGTSIPCASFSLLKEIKIFGCPSMKKLFPPNLLPNLQNLEKIGVSNCKNMVELIGTQDEEEESNESSASVEFTLPKLRSLILISLPELKSICRGKMICKSLEYMKLCVCEQLKKMSLSLVLMDRSPPICLPSLKRILINPMEWWEWVELDHPNAKDLLSSVVERASFIDSFDYFLD